MKMNRAVGYCENLDCENFARGHFLLVSESTGPYTCAHCHVCGRRVDEKGSYTGDPAVFHEVRVEFNYDPCSGEYLKIGIVRDDELQSLLKDSGIYTFQSPLIRTETRALRAAETILSQLNLGGGIVNGEVPSTGETVISFDEPIEDLRDRLTILEDGWMMSKYREVTTR